MKIAFLGDIAIFENGMLQSGWNTRLKKVKEVLSQHDMVVANLEVPLTNRKKTLVCKGIHLKSNEKVIDVLKYLDISGVCLSNNHICDFGVMGMEDTLKLLQQARIEFYGINNKSWIKNFNYNTLAFHGFCCYSTNGAKYISFNNKKGVIPFTKSSVINALDEDKKNNRLSIISIHWGDEYSQLPNEQQVDFLHNLSKKYKFILHGHHAHVMQGIEYINNSLLAYNQGNFCFDECTSHINPKLIIKQTSLNKESYILSVEIEKNNIISWDTLGIFHDNNTIEIINNKEKIQLISDKISNCKQKPYKQESIDMIKSQKQNNLAKHDFKWLISKLNYYSIGAKLISYYNKKLYKKSYKDD